MERFFTYSFCIETVLHHSHNNQLISLVLNLKLRSTGVPCSRKSRSATYRRASGSGQRSENLTFLAVRDSKEPLRRAVRHICNGGASK